MRTALEIAAVCLLAGGWTLLTGAGTIWAIRYVDPATADDDDREIACRALKLGTPLTIAGHALGSVVLW